MNVVVSQIEVKEAIAQLDKPFMQKTNTEANKSMTEKLNSEKVDDNPIGFSANRRRLKIFQNITLTKSSGVAGGSKKKQLTPYQGVNQLNKKLKP